MKHRYWKFLWYGCTENCVKIQRQMSEFFETAGLEVLLIVPLKWQWSRLQITGLHFAKLQQESYCSIKLDWGYWRMTQNKADTLSLIHTNTELSCIWIGFICLGKVWWSLYWMCWSVRSAFFFYSHGITYSLKYLFCKQRSGFPQLVIMPPPTFFLIQML